MKPRTAGPLSGQQHEPWMAEEREDDVQTRGPIEVPVEILFGGGRK